MLEQTLVLVECDGDGMEDLPQGLCQSQEMMLFNSICILQV